MGKKCIAGKLLYTAIEKGTLPLWFSKQAKALYLFRAVLSPLFLNWEVKRQNQKMWCDFDPMEVFHLRSASTFTSKDRGFGTHLVGKNSKL